MSEMSMTTERRATRAMERAAEGRGRAAGHPGRGAFRLAWGCRVVMSLDQALIVDRHQGVIPRRAKEPRRTSYAREIRGG